MDWKFNALLNKKLEDLTYVVVDIETTGSKPEKDSLLEVAAVRIEKLQEKSIFVTLVKPSKKIPEFIKKLTGITDLMVEYSPGPERILPQFFDFVKDSIFVGHDVNFDYRFLVHKILKHYGERLEIPTICTLKLTQKLFPEFPKRNLKYLSQKFDIKFEAPHRALSDARLTAKIFLLYLRFLKLQGITTLKELILFQESKIFGIDKNSLFLKEYYLKLVPQRKGIFFLKNNNKVVYQQKADDIKKDLKKLFFFSAKSKNEKIFRKITDVDYQVIDDNVLLDYLDVKFYRENFPSFPIFKKKMYFIQFDKLKLTARMVSYFQPNSSHYIYLGPFLEKKDGEKILDKLFQIYNFEEYPSNKEVFFKFFKNFRLHYKKIITSFSQKQVKSFHQYLKRLYLNSHYFLTHKFLLKSVSENKEYYFLIVEGILLKYWKININRKNEYFDIIEWADNYRDFTFLDEVISENKKGRRFYLPIFNTEVLLWLDYLWKFWKTDNLWEV